MAPDLRGGRAPKRRPHLATLAGGHQLLGDAATPGPVGVPHAVVAALVGRGGGRGAGGADSSEDPCKMGSKKVSVSLVINQLNHHSSCRKFAILNAKSTLATAAMTDFFVWRILATFYLSWQFFYN